ncbi:diphthamide synthesis DPH2 family protein [Klebsormidium nitens]|uniref:Diphthamide synthesis DPH2 family protein n=1 Tax=Klebsormidium nitens TaxID=105231 RepID=A0A1Y1HP32_KLENI|nr:diphthamide synthesis DPH2 family protein [Klebsormidium nitens]|eukprot:GAQ80395.1 diphthamide synthesis DPH2 family protein [Klebsormidium nitens]
MAQAGLHSAEWWVPQAELLEIASFILRRGFSRVALQFPDELLAASPDVAAAITSACNSPTTSNRPFTPPANYTNPPSQPPPNPALNPASTQQSTPAPPKPPLNQDSTPSDHAPSHSEQGPTQNGAEQNKIVTESKGPVRVFVLADTTYGSCCVDEVAAAHADAQCVVHFGRACLSPTSRLPVRFVFGAAPIDVDDCSAHLRSLAEKTGKPLLVLFGLEYAHAIPPLRAALERSGLADIRFADLPPVELEPASGSGPCEAQGGASSGAQSPSGGDRGGADKASVPSQSRGTETGQSDEATRTRTTGGKDEPEFNEGALGGENDSVSEGDAKAERVRFSTQAESSGAEQEFRSGGLTWHLYGTERMSDFEIVWVGSEGPALTDVMLTHNGCQVARYDPDTRKLLTDVSDNSRFLRRRYYLVERAKNAAIVGIVVGTLSSAGFRDVIKRLRHVIAAAGKKSYTFVMGKPNPAKLANFPECEVFVLVACPQTALLDSKEYLSPVITPFEAELAFVEKRVWTGEYRLDYGGLATGNGLQNGLGSEGKGDGEDDSEEDEPRFSLISGTYEPGGVQEVTPEAEGSSALAVVGNGVKDLQVRGEAGALTLAGERRQQSAAKTGAEYLVSKRTYQGLTVPQHMLDEGGVTQLMEKTPVVPAVKGRSGRAARYADER